MTRCVIAVVVTSVLSSSALGAGQKPPVPPPPPPGDSAPVGPGAPPPPPAAPAPDGRARKLGPNVRVEVTFTEQRAERVIPPKTVTVTTNDGQWGRVRSTVVSGIFGTSPLNVDAKPAIQTDGRVLLSLNLEYGESRVPEGQTPKFGQAVASTLNESVTVLLKTGEALTVTQSADPMSDRKVTVDVKATVLRN